MAELYAPELYAKNFQQLIHDVEAATGNAFKYRSSEYDGKGKVTRMYDCNASLWFPAHSPLLALEFIGQSGKTQDKKITVYRLLEKHDKVFPEFKLQHTGVLLWLSDSLPLLYSELMFVPLVSNTSTDTPSVSFLEAVTQHDTWPAQDLYVHEDNQNRRWFSDRDSVAKHLAMVQHADSILKNPNPDLALKTAAAHVLHQALLQKPLAKKPEKQ